MDRDLRPFWDPEEVGVKLAPTWETYSFRWLVFLTILFMWWIQFFLCSLWPGKYYVSPLNVSIQIDRAILIKPNTKLLVVPSVIERRVKHLLPLAQEEHHLFQFSIQVDLFIEGTR